MTEELLKFSQFADEIRCFGFLGKSTTVKGIFDDLKIIYILTLNNGVTLCLFDSNFCCTIEVVYSTVQETYQLSLNKLDNTFYKIEKHTQERYGNLYKISEIYVLDKIQEQLLRLDKNVAIKNKFENSLKDAMERIIPDTLIDGYYGYRFIKSYAGMSGKEQGEYKECTDKYRKIRYSWEIEDLRRMIMGISKNNFALSFIPNEMNLSEYELTSIDKIRDFLLKTNTFIIKRRNVKKIFDFDLEIISKNQVLYLSCKTSYKIL